MGLFSMKKSSVSSSPSSAKPSTAKQPSNDAKDGAEVKHGEPRKTDDVTNAVESGNTEGNEKDAVGEDQDLDDHVPEKKQYAKEKAPPKASPDTENDVSLEPESETLLNTKLNAMLYHTSEDSIDLYRSENNSSDLLGRLYYDDYDPENRQVVERITSFTSIQSLARAPPSPAIKSKSEFASPETAKRPSFARQVSFDTLSDSHHSAITLKVKHPEFKFRRNNKTILIGFSNDSESIKAVEWAFLELVISGDTIIVLQVLDEKSHHVVDPALAESVLDRLKTLNTHSKRISLVYEVVIGNPQKLLKKAILEYKPAMMIVGTHQYGSAPPAEYSGASASSASLTPFLSHPPVKQGFHGSSNHHSSGHSLHRSFFSKSSTSKYFLQYALVPVILVKPFYTIQETLDKPIDSETYFSDWLANIDVNRSREKKKKHMFGMRSPSSSRNSSHTSLSDFMHPERSHERIHEKISEQLQMPEKESRGRSGGSSFMIGESRDPSRSRSHSGSSPMGRRSASKDTSQDATLDARSRSRSRSRLSRLFTS